MSNKTNFQILFLMTALVAGPSFAHTGDHAHGFAAGFIHPLSGLDHLLAMLAVGLWAAQNRRPANWLLTIAFPLAMAAGALAGYAGWTMAGLELGIAGSVALLGLLVAGAVRLPVVAGVTLISLLAVMHGLAHGGELPSGASPLAYGAGFMLSTLLLHAAGLLIAKASAAGSLGRHPTRYMGTLGAALTAAGACLLAAA